jgi:hypothetical protein
VLAHEEAIMLSLKYLLMWCGMGMIAVAAGLLICDFQRETKCHVITGDGVCFVQQCQRWRSSVALALLAWGPLVAAAGIVVARA